MAHRNLPALALALAVSVTTFSVHAQIQQRKADHGAQKPAAAAGDASTDPVVTAEDGASYGVQFDDELLSAIAGDGTIPRITVRAVKGFGQLARARVSFVRELQKSVEVM